MHQTQLFSMFLHFSGCMMLCKTASNCWSHCKHWWFLWTTVSTLYRESNQRVLDCFSDWVITISVSAPTLFSITISNLKLPACRSWRAVFLPSLMKRIFLLMAAVMASEQRAYRSAPVMWLGQRFTTSCSFTAGSNWNLEKKNTVVFFLQ